MSKIKAGRMMKKKRNASAKTEDCPPIESKVVEPDDSESQETEPSTIQILFDNANIDGSISYSAENLELLKKLWTEIGKSSEFNIEEIKTVGILMSIFH